MLATDFFAPCMCEATLYRRAAGYFSSMSLITWADALPRLIQDRSLKIQLISSPELGSQDISVFKELNDEKKLAEYRIIDRMLEEIIALADRPGDQSVRAKI